MLCVLLMVSCVWSSVGFASTPTTLSPAEVKALTDKAKTMVATQNVVQAIVIYEQIYDGTRDPKYLYNIGYLHEDSGQLDMAWDYYQRFLLAWPDAPNAKDLQTYLGELAQKLREAYVLIHVFTTPPGATVAIVTEEATRTPSSVTPMSTWMPFGPVTLRLTHEGYEPLEKKITVKAGKSQRLRLTLTQRVVPGVLTIGSMPPDATLTLDGAPQTRVVPGGTLTLQPGKRTLTLTFADGTRREGVVTVADGKVSDLPLDWWAAPAPPPSTPGDASGTGADLSASASAPSGDTSIPLGTWITGAAALGLAAAGIAVQVMASDQFTVAEQANADFYAVWDDSLAEQPESTHALARTWQDEDQTYQTLQTTSAVLFGVAGAAALTSVIWLLVDTPSGDAQDAARIAPLIAPGRLGAAATWSF